MSKKQTSRRQAALSLMLALAGSCAPAEVTATQLLVHVQAGPAAATRLKYVRAFLYAPDATDESKWAEELHFPASASASGATVPFPFSFGIAPGASDRFLLVLKGYDSSDPAAPPVIEQKARIGFQTEQKLQVRLGLLDACLQRAGECSGLAQTCGATGATAQCTPVPLVTRTGDVPPEVGVGVGGDAGVPEQDPVVRPDAATAVDAKPGDGGAPPEPPATSVIPMDNAGRLQALCDRGDMGACTDLGILYEDGVEGVAVNLPRAAQLYQKACDGSYARGCANLGLAYYDGLGVTQDRVRASTFFQKGCELGSGRACTNFGTQLESGADIGMDVPRAVEVYLRACTMGEAVGCGNAGNHFRHGIFVARDYARAIELERQACNGGDMGGCNDVGFHYAQALGVTRDMVRAAELFRQACAGGEPQGCANLDRYGLR